MTKYRLEANPIVELEIESAFVWYEAEQPGLGYAFLQQLRTAYNRILDNPHAYQEIRSGIRRALTRQFRNLFPDRGGNYSCACSVTHGEGS